MTIEIETGPMFSGKTSALLSQAEKCIKEGKISGINFLVFNHKTDDSYGKNVICSHNHDTLEAIPAKSSKDIFNEIFSIEEDDQISLKTNRDQLSFIFIDEAQFFDIDLPNIIDFIHSYYRDNLGKNIYIYCAGLDMDFRGEPFGPMPQLMAIATKVNKFAAECKDCHTDTSKNAFYTQRLINGAPAKYNDPILLVGASESYTARCHKHHIVPGKPTPKFK